MKKPQVHLCETEISLILYKLLGVICLEFLSAFDRMDWDFIHTIQVDYSDIMIFLSSFLDVIKMSISTASFLAQLDSGILCPHNALL